MKSFQSRLIAFWESVITFVRFKLTFENSAVCIRIKKSIKEYKNLGNCTNKYLNLNEKWDFKVKRS